MYAGFVCFYRHGFLFLLKDCIGMKGDETIISGIEYKARVLVRELSVSKQKNISLLNKIELLNEQIKQNRTEINNLKEKNKTLKLAKSLEIGPGKSQAHIMINELVREIDKSIGLLNI
jgi:hypothetical protein